MIQTSTVNVGDDSALLARLDELGLASADCDEFVAALQADQATDGPRSSGYLTKVGSGAIHLATGLATDATADILIALGRAYLGFSS